MFLPERFCVLIRRFLAAVCLVLLPPPGGSYASPPCPPTSLTLVERTATGAELQWTPGPGEVLGFKLRPSSIPGVHPDPAGYPGNTLAAVTWTTDDGYSDNLKYLPAFASRGLSFTAFVNSGTLGKPTRMTWSQLEYLHEQGVEIANHTRDHRALINDRALAIRYVGPAGTCVLTVEDNLLKTLVDGVPGLSIYLTDTSAQYIATLVQTLDDQPDYEATLLYSDAKQFATESRFLDEVEDLPIASTQPETLTTAVAVHDDDEMMYQILQCKMELENFLTAADPSYTCRFLAFPYHAHTQWAMSMLNSLGVVGARAGGRAPSPPFQSFGSYDLGYMTTYECPLQFPERPSNSWSEATTRSTYHDRLAVWKANQTWAILLSHNAAEADSEHVEWMVDEIASDPDVWLANFGEVSGYLSQFYIDVGNPIDGPGAPASAWIRDLAPTDSLYVVVTQYNSNREESTWSNELFIPSAASLGLPDNPVPPGLALGGRPNPFSSRVSLSYSLTEREPVVLRIHDVAGRLVKVLVNEVEDSGEQEILWNGTDDKGVRVATGVYFARLQAGEQRVTAKLFYAP